MGKGEFKMIEKGKKYTYEELKEILKKAEKETTEALAKDYKETAGEKADPMGEFAFIMPIMLGTHKMTKILLGEDN